MFLFNFYLTYCNLSLLALLKLTNKAEIKNYISYLKKITQLIKIYVFFKVF